MHRRLSLHVTAILLVILAGRVGSGCSSTKIIMTPPVKMAVVPEKNKTSYRVEKVAIAFAGNNHSPGHRELPTDWQDGHFAGQFSTLAERRYPQLFNKSRMAIPVSVRIEIADEVHQGATLGAYLCTVGIIGGIFPSVPWSTEWQVRIQAEDSQGTPILSTKFQAENRGWFSLFTPLGLIAIPGDSDAPKVSMVIDGGPNMTHPAHRAYVTQCMVDLLAAELLKVNPAKLPARTATPMTGTVDPMTPSDTIPLPNF